jgi:hypothetical protein
VWSSTDSAWVSCNYKPRVVGADYDQLSQVGVGRNVIKYAAAYRQGADRHLGLIRDSLSHMVLEAQANRCRGVRRGVIVVSSGGEREQRGLTEPRLHLCLMQDGV